MPSIELILSTWKGQSPLLTPPSSPLSPQKQGERKKIRQQQRVAAQRKKMFQRLPGSGQDLTVVTFHPSKELPPSNLFSSQRAPSSPLSSSSSNSPPTFHQVEQQAHRKEDQRFKKKARTQHPKAPSDSIQRKKEEKMRTQSRRKERVKKYSKKHSWLFSTEPSAPFLPQSLPPSREPTRPVQTPKVKADLPAKDTSHLSSQREPSLLPSPSQHPSANSSYTSCTLV